MTAISRPLKIAGTQATAGMKVPTGKTEMLLKSEMTAAAGTTASYVISSRTARKTVEKPATFSRDTSNSSRNSQRDHSATEAETIGTSQTSSAEGRQAIARMPEIVETSQQQ